MAESTMEEVVNVEGDLQPCDICGRTFLPVPLTKHIRVCERNANRKRKVFDSLKQRVEGTELAPFHQRTYLKRPNVSTAPETNRQSSKWREKHFELVKTIRAARGLPTNEMPASPKRTASNTAAGSERCPSCDRQFGPRAYDRHVEWCKEHMARIQKSPAEVRLAKERLEARTKYRVPPPKSKRSVIREKYSPTLGTRTESVSSVKSISCTNLERSPSVRKPRSLHNSKKVVEQAKHEHFSDAAVDLHDTHGDNVVKPHVKEKCVPKEPKIPVIELKSPHPPLAKPRTKLNTIEVNDSVRGMTVSQMKVGEGDTKEPKKLVTWRDTVRNATPTSVASANSSLLKKTVNEQKVVEKKTNNKEMKFMTFSSDFKRVIPIKKQTKQIKTSTSSPNTSVKIKNLTLDADIFSPLDTSRSIKEAKETKAKCIADKRDFYRAKESKNEAKVNEEEVIIHVTNKNDFNSLKSRMQERNSEKCQKERAVELDVEGEDIITTKLKVPFSVSKYRKAKLLSDNKLKSFEKHLSLKNDCPTISEHDEEGVNTDIGSPKDNTMSSPAKHDRVDFEMSDCIRVDDCDVKLENKSFKGGTVNNYLHDEDQALEIDYNYKTAKENLQLENDKASTFKKLPKNHQGVDVNVEKEKVCNPSPIDSSHEINTEKTSQPCSIENQTTIEKPLASSQEDYNFSIASSLPADNLENVTTETKMYDSCKLRSSNILSTVQEICSKEKYCANIELESHLVEVKSNFEDVVETGKRNYKNLRIQNLGVVCDIKSFSSMDSKENQLPKDNNDGYYIKNEVIQEDVEENGRDKTWETAPYTKVNRLGSQTSEKFSNLEHSSEKCKIDVLDTQEETSSSYNKQNEFVKAIAYVDVSEKLPEYSAEEIGATHKTVEVENKPTRNSNEDNTGIRKSSERGTIKVNTVDTNETTNMKEGSSKSAYNDISNKSDTARNKNRKFPEGTTNNIDKTLNMEKTSCSEFQANNSKHKNVIADKSRKLRGSDAIKTVGDDTHKNVNIKTSEGSEGNNNKRVQVSTDKKSAARNIKNRKTTHNLKTCNFDPEKPLNTGKTLVAKECEGNITKYVDETFEKGNYYDRVDHNVDDDYKILDAEELSVTESSTEYSKDTSEKDNVSINIRIGKLHEDGTAEVGVNDDTYKTLTDEVGTNITGCKEMINKSNLEKDVKNNPISSYKKYQGTRNYECDNTIVVSDGVSLYFQKNVVEAEVNNLDESRKTDSCAKPTLSDYKDHLNNSSRGCCNLNTSSKVIYKEKNYDSDPHKSSFKSEDSFIDFSETYCVKENSEQDSIKSGSQEKCVTGSDSYDDVTKWEGNDLTTVTSISSETQEFSKTDVSVLHNFFYESSDIESLDCVDVDIWNEALSVARVERSIRKCSSAVCLSVNKSTHNNFATYTELDLGKFTTSNSSSLPEEYSLYLNDYKSDNVVTQEECLKLQTNEGLLDDQILEIAGEQFIASFRGDGDSLAVKDVRLKEMGVCSVGSNISSSAECVPMKRRKLDDVIEDLALAESSISETSSMGSTLNKVIVEHSLTKNLETIKLRKMRTEQELEEDNCNVSKTVGIVGDFNGSQSDESLENGVEVLNNDRENLQNKTYMEKKNYISSVDHSKRSSASETDENLIENFEEEKAIISPVGSVTVSDRQLEMKKRKHTKEPTPELLCSATAVPIDVSPQLLNIINSLNRNGKEENQTETRDVVVISKEYYKKLLELDPRVLDFPNKTKLPQIGLRKAKLCDKGNTIAESNEHLKLTLPPINLTRYAQTSKIPVVKDFLGKKCCEGKESITLPEIVTQSDKQSDYNPFVTAERQLMELLECDDFKPFFSKPTTTPKHIKRPHTTANTKSKLTAIHKNNKVVKSAENARQNSNVQSKSNSKRSSVIDPPMDFQDDKLNALHDDFELIESLINQNYIEGFDVNNELSDFNFDSISNKIAKSFFLHSDANDNEQSGFATKERKYSDDMSSIDPRLINENDNLSIPENLKIEGYSSNSSNDNVAPLKSNLHKENYESKKTLKNTTTDKMNRSVDETYSTPVKNSKQITESRRSIKPIKQTTKNVHKSTASITSSFGATRNNLTADKKKNLSSLKRSVSLADPVKPKNLKNKQDVQNYFDEQDRKNAIKADRNSPERPVLKTQVSENINVFNSPTAEELFAVDDEMYEEYKKYEEMYLREKQQKMQNEKKPEEVASSGTLTPNEGSDNVPTNVKVSADSAYSSLNRKTPKIRARSTKLAPLDYQGSHSSPIGSPTSSGSEASPTFLKRSAGSQRMSKFCHECGNRYPINTAKFCVECGVKRLLL